SAYSVQLSTGTGLGAPMTSLFDPCTTPLATDVDGDGRADLVSNQADSGCSMSMPAALRLDDTGKPTSDPMSFTDASGRVHYWALPAFGGYSAVLGDFNGDGLDDYLLLPVNTNPWNTPVSLVWNTGNGLVLDGHTVDLPYDKFVDVRVADVNGDGRDDL